MEGLEETTKIYGRGGECSLSQASVRNRNSGRRLQIVCRETPDCVQSRRARPSGKGRAGRLGSASHGGGRVDEWRTARSRSTHRCFCGQQTQAAYVCCNLRLHHTEYFNLWKTLAMCTVEIHTLHVYHRDFFVGDYILFHLLVPVLQTRFPAEKRHMFALNLFSLKL